MKHEHFWVMCAAASTALVLIVGAAGAAGAQDQTTTVVGQRADDGLSVRVSYRDLNLAAAKDQRILNRRVGGAANDVCEPHFDDMERGSCISYAWRGARPQIAMAVKRAHELALNGTTSIPLVAIAITAR